ncbi:MAG: EamA family transporter [Alphaproteobacteria bacterium]
MWLLPALAALFIWGFWAFLPKLALQSLDPHSVIFYESFGNMLVALPIMFHLKFKLQKDRKAVSMLAGSAVLTVLAILAYFYALKTGPVAVIVTLTALYPVISVILARIVLKEKLNKVQIAAVLMAVSAMLLLAA